MPAYFDSGFSVRKPMWHGQGVVLGEYPKDWAEARKYAGLTWEPEERPHFVLSRLDEWLPKGCRGCLRLTGTVHDDECALIACGTAAAGSEVTIDDIIPLGTRFVQGQDELFVPDPTHKDIVRDDTYGVLGVASNEFSVIKHGVTDGFASMEQIVDTFVGTGVKFETGGSLRDGKFVWSLMYLDEPYKVAGDDSEHLPFLALLNAHDGSSACKLVETQVRVVCWNTFQMASASGDSSGRQIVFRHSGDVQNRIAEAQETVTDLREEVRQYVEMGETLAKIQADSKAFDAYLSEFLPNPAENGEVVSDRVQANVEKARDAFRFTYENSATCAEVSGSAWGLVQASTEYLDHARAFRSRDTYLGRSILGVDKSKRKAIGIVGDLFGDQLARLDTEWAHRIISIGEDQHQRDAHERALATRTLTV